MSRRPTIREATDAAFLAHSFFTNEQNFPYCEYRYHRDHDGNLRLIGGNADHVKQVISEGLSHIAAAQALYEKCTIGMAASSVEKIEFSINAALRFLDRERERLDELLALPFSEVMH